MAQCETGWVERARSDLTTRDRIRLRVELAEMDADALDRFILRATGAALALADQERMRRLRETQIAAFEADQAI